MGWAQAGFDREMKPDVWKGVLEGGCSCRKAKTMLGTEPRCKTYRRGLIRHCACRRRELREETGCDNERIGERSEPRELGEACLVKVRKVVEVGVVVWEQIWN